MVYKSTQLAKDQISSKWQSWDLRLQQFDIKACFAECQCGD
jgi:hypothetical protein